MTPAGLAVERLSVHHAGAARRTPGAVTLAARPGEITAVTGPSGCGKSTLLWAILGLVPDGAVVEGTILLDGAPLTPAAQRAARGRRIGLLLQDPAHAFDPRRPLIAGFHELLAHHLGLDGQAADLRTHAVVDRVGVDRALLRRAPSEVSGGQLQRLALALALAPGPTVLLCDEPTSALDAIARATVLRLLRDTADAGAAILWVTHDLRAANAIADHTEALGPLREPAPPPRRAAAPAATAPALVADRVTVRRSDSHVLDAASLQVAPGECVAVVGVSGSGKTTLARALCCRIPVDGGVVRVSGVDAATLPRRALARQVQLMLQDTTDTLDPRQTVADALRRVLEAHTTLDAAGVDARVTALLGAVDLDDALKHRRPAELSGGQRQRVALARALAVDAPVLLCDEPVSALDPETAANVLDLLRREVDHGRALLLITHDLDAAVRIADRVILLEEGHTQDAGPGATLCTAPPPGAAAALVAAAKLPARQ